MGQDLSCYGDSVCGGVAVPHKVLLFNCTFTPKDAYYSPKRNTVQNIYIVPIAHHVNHLKVPSCSSKHSDWLSGHLQPIADSYLHRVELFSTLIDSFTAIAQAFLSLLSFYRACLIESEWAFIARNAL